MLTKQDRQQLVEDFKETFSTKDDIKDLKNDIANYKVEIIGRLDTIDQELAVKNGSDDQLQHHEIRIEVLEKKLKLS